jgi:hypothetical protein
MLQIVERVRLLNRMHFRLMQSGATVAIATAVPLPCAGETKPDRLSAMYAR